METVFRPRFLPGQTPLYFVTDHHLNAGRPKLDVITAALRGGVRLIQYRDKELSDVEFEAEARTALSLCRNLDATFIVNDRVHIALKIGADGVHLGQDDMPPKEARQMLGSRAILGLSTHNEVEVLAAQFEPVSYINIGPMFPTGTKKHLQTLGFEEVLRLSRLTTHPWTAMGGIKREQLRFIFNQGVRTAALVTAISMAENVEIATQALIAESRPVDDNS